MIMSVGHALLALLSDGPKYGMQLRNEYEAKRAAKDPAPGSAPRLRRRVVVRQ